MNKEAIERTKARCKKEIKGKDRIYVLPGFYVKKPKIPEWDCTKEYAIGESVMFNGNLCDITSSSAGAKPEPVVLGGRAYSYTTGKEIDSYLQDESVQMPNTLVPETGREALIAIILTSIMWALFTWLVLL